MVLLFSFLSKNPEIPGIPIPAVESSGPASPLHAAYARQWLERRQCACPGGDLIVSSMVVFGSHKRWDRWHSPSPNWQEKYHLYTTYILPSRGLYNPYHLLPEPEKSIDVIGLPWESKGPNPPSWTQHTYYGGTWIFLGMARNKKRQNM